tara:strand:+ start:25348 stop:26745 length:1398 start_codon:yes stop_codon:yes gene_type:complete
MFIKIFKNIHSKYSNFFKFFFFLKYLLAIFFISILLFLVIPKFFNYGDKTANLKNYLLENYYIELKANNLIEYKIFPLPHLSIQKTVISFKDRPTFISSDETIIFLSFKSIYNFDNLNIKKIIFNQSEIILQNEKVKDLIYFLKNSKKKVKFKNLDLIFYGKDKKILSLNEIQFSNYGYKKNNMSGKIFNKVFKLSFDNSKLNFKINNTGIKISVLLDEEFYTDGFSGSSTVSILNNFLIINFVGDEKQISIKKSKLRNKNLSVSFNSLINTKPFFESNSTFIITKIKSDFISNLNFEKILDKKEIIKKLNGKNNIEFKNNNSFNKIIKKLSLEIDFKFGMMNYRSSIFFEQGSKNCEGNSSLLDEYPRLSFDCEIKILDRKKFLNKFSIKNKFDNKKLIIKTQGNINLLNKKINFEKIKIGRDNFANQEDVRYYKELFERVLFDENFLKVFKKNKIKNFLIEII